MKHDGGKGKKPYGNIDIGKIKYAIKSTLSVMSIKFITVRSNMAWPDPRWIGLISASVAMWKPVSMHRLGEAIQCDLKALRMSKVDHGMSGYAALTRPTGLKEAGIGKYQHGGGRNFEMSRNHRRIDWASRHIKKFLLR